MFNELDVVKVLENIPMHGIHAGRTGTIVHIHTAPRIAYEVEFLDEDGEMLAMIPLTESQLSVEWRMPQRSLAA
ncbi:MAG: DUF4926 domain-containing protein [Rhodoferax sp.]